MATNILTKLTEIYFDPDFIETVQLGGDDAVTNGAPSATDCQASTATFTSDGVAVGDIAFNETTGNYALITVVVSETALTTAVITGDWTATDTVQIFQKGVQGLPVYTPSFDWFRQETITNTGLKGRARNDADIPGAGWMEGTFYFDMVGFEAWTDVPAAGARYNPPYWARLCKNAAMAETSGFSSASWIYQVDDDIHLSDDTVHTSGKLEPMTGYINIDGTYHAFEDAISDLTFSVDVTAGSPRLTVNRFVGNVYEDTSNNFYPFPTTDVPADIVTVADTFEAPLAVDSMNATLTMSILLANGTTTVVLATPPCLRSWSHTIGNNIAEQRCMQKEYKLDQFLVTDQDANTATLVVRAIDPGTFSSPADFNPEEINRNRDMIRLSITHNAGVTLGTIKFESDYYIQSVSKAPDSAGVLEYTLTLQQANLIPALSAATKLKITCS